MTPKEKEEYSSKTIQGLNDRVSEIEKKIAILADTTRKLALSLETIIKLLPKRK
jgi:hypothetical protein